MVRLEGFMEIQQLHHDGVSVSEIARRLNMDRKTVRKYLRQVPRAYERKAKSWKIDPFRGYLRERWELGVQNAARLFTEIQKRGYSGEARARSGRLSASRRLPESRPRWTGAISATGAVSGCTASR